MRDYFHLIKESKHRKIKDNFNLVNRYNKEIRICNLKILSLSHQINFFPDL